MLLELRKAIEKEELYEFLSQESHNLSKEDLITLCKELVWAIPKETSLFYNEVLNELDDRLFYLEELTLGDLLGKDNITTIPISTYYYLSIENKKNDLGFLLVELIENGGDVIDTIDGATRETNAFELKKEGVRLLKCLWEKH